MSGPSQLQAGQQDIYSVETQAQQNMQDLAAAKQLGDAAEVALLQKQIEQLGEKELILLRAEALDQVSLHAKASGQLCLQRYMSR